MARVYGRRRVAAAPQARASLLVRALEGLHLSTQMLLPALGSLGLIVVHGESLIGKLLLFGWLPILVFQLLDFAHHRPPRSTTAALVMALSAARSGALIWPDTGFVRCSLDDEKTSSALIPTMGRVNIFINHAAKERNAPNLQHGVRWQPIRSPRSRMPPVRLVHSATAARNQLKILARRYH